MRVFACFELVQQVLGALLSPPLERREIVEPEREEIGGVLHQAGVPELLRLLLAESADVHAQATGEVLEVTHDLRGAGEVRAADRDASPPRARRACRRRGRRAGTTMSRSEPSAARAAPSPRAESRRPPARRRRGRLRLTPRRSSSSTLCSVALDTCTPARRTGSRSARGVTVPVRPTLQTTCLQGRLGALRRELPGHGPARRAVASAQSILQRRVVDLDDHAVDLEGEGVAVREQRRVRLRHALASLDARRCGPPSACPSPGGRRAALSGWRTPLPRPRHGVGEVADRAGRGDGRVEHAQRCRRRGSAGWRRARRPRLRAGGSARAKSSFRMYASPRTAR